MTLEGDEAPKRNEKTTAFLRKGRSFFCENEGGNVKNATLSLENLHISKDNCNFAAIKE